MPKKSKSLSFSNQVLVLSILLVGLALAIFATSQIQVWQSSAKGARLNTQNQPVGPHYTLMVTSIKPDLAPKMATKTFKKKILIQENTTPKINLSTASTYSVTDSNAIDGQASVGLPNPDPNGDGVTEYSVYVKAVGKPNKQTAITPCTDIRYEGFDTAWCSTQTKVVVRQPGIKPEDASAQILYLYADLNEDNQLERYALFDEALKNIYWEYDDQGVKNAQIKFYEIVSNVN